MSLFWPSFCADQPLVKSDDKDITFLPGASLVNCRVVARALHRVLLVPGEDRHPMLFCQEIREDGHILVLDSLV